MVNYKLVKNITGMTDWFELLWYAG